MLFHVLPFSLKGTTGSLCDSQVLLFNLSQGKHSKILLHNRELSRFLHVTLLHYIIYLLLLMFLSLKFLHFLSEVLKSLSISCFTYSLSQSSILPLQDDSAHPFNTYHCCHCETSASRQDHDPNIPMTVPASQSSPVQPSSNRVCYSNS